MSNGDTPDLIHSIPDRLALHAGYTLCQQALRDIAKLIVTFDPDRAERLVKSQGNRALHDNSLVTLVKMLAPTNPVRAERMARSIIDPEDREIAMHYVRRDR